MKEEVDITAKQLVIIGIIILSIALAALIFNVKTKTTETHITPAQYDYLEDAKIKKKHSIEINKGKYEFLPDKKTEAYSYNNQIPGPLIKGKTGDVIQVDVKNNLEEPTTIHWHGLILNNINDGVPQITQNLILPGEKFRYEIELRNPGLYWYHSHANAHKQVESGLSGAILVEDPEKKTDEGNLLILDDVLLGSDHQLRDFNLGVMHGRFGNHLLVNGKIKPNVSLKNNRLRIVNTANARSFNLNFGNRPVTILGMDIGNSDKHQRSTLIIHPGERYDVLIDIDKKEEIILSHATSTSNHHLARLFLKGNKIEKPNHADFKPPFSAHEMREKEPDLNAELYGFQGGRKGIIWSINGKYFPDTTEIFNVNKGDTVKIRLKNLQGQPHPMHLHGQKFIVTSRNGRPQNNMGWKDTVMVGSSEEVDIIFTAEEKGDWAFHCHILEHAEAGMLSILRVN